MRLASFAAPFLTWTLLLAACSAWRAACAAGAPAAAAWCPSRAALALLAPRALADAAALAGPFAL